MAYKYRIRVMESERGWGQDVWTEDYNTVEEAKARIQSVNTQDYANVSAGVPDWYMRAFEEITLVEV
jgi:hypothetical protein